MYSAYGRTEHSTQAQSVEDGPQDGGCRGTDGVSFASAVALWADANPLILRDRLCAEAVKGSVVEAQMSDSDKKGSILPGEGIPKGEGIMPGEGILPGEGIPKGEGIMPGEGIAKNDGQIPGEETILPEDGRIPDDDFEEPEDSTTEPATDSE